MSGKSHAHLLELAALINESVQTVLAEYAAVSRVVPSLDCADPAQTLVNRTIRDTVRVLEAACAQLCASVAPAEYTMTNRAFEMVNPACIHVALTARTAEHLRDGPKSVAELATLAGMDANKLGRVLRNLATKHCFREVSKDVFANNKLSVCLLPEDPTSGLIGHFVDEIYTGLGSLCDVLSDPKWGASTDRDETAFVRAHRMPIFEMFAKDPVRGSRFPVAMRGWTKVNGGAGIIADAYPWATALKDAIFCDLGGSVGHVAMALSEAHPQLKVIVQDLQPVISQADELWRKTAPQALADERARLVPVDFLVESPVEGCDFYYLKHILHDWPDADCISILKNTRRAMSKPHAKVLVHEGILLHASADNENAAQAPPPLLPNFGVGAQRRYDQDINMMAAFNARERTLDEYISIGAQVGLKFVQTWEAGDMTMIEFEAS